MIAESLFAKMSRKLFNRYFVKMGPGLINLIKIIVHKLYAQPFTRYRNRKFIPILNSSRNNRPVSNAIQKFHNVFRVKCTSGEQIQI